MVTDSKKGGSQTQANKMPKISVNCADLRLSNCSCHLGRRTRRNGSCITRAFIV